MISRTLLALIPLLAACSTPAVRDPSPSSPTVPVDASADLPSAPLPKVGDVRVLHKISWFGAWGQHLLGVDSERGHAFLRLEKTSPAAFAIDTVDLRTGERLGRWQATTSQAAKLVNRYPQFRPLSGTLTSDLERYSKLLGRAGPWWSREASPPFSVLPSPDGVHTLYATAPTDGRDGDWLMLHTPGKAPRRFDPGIRASYRANFSPDGRLVAWIGGSAQYARRGANVGYVLRLAGLRGTPRAIPEVRDVMRTPIWAPDSSRVYALGSGSTTRSRCLFEITLKGFTRRTLYCHEGEVDVLMRPDGARFLLLLHPPRGASVEASARTLVWIDPARSAPLSTFSLERPQGLGAFGVFVDPETVAVFAQDGTRLQLVRPATGKLVEDITLDAGFLTGRRAAAMMGDELIALRRLPDRVEVVAVKVR